MLGSFSQGFFAQAYTWNGQTVISYRGTDSGADFTRGWSASLGVAGTFTQGDEALAFYRTVTGLDYWQGAATNTILTGHSLGGGLAGFVGSLSGTATYSFDYSPFSLSAWLHA